jgi:hypothetical protein
VLNLEMLAYNFHESLNLKPLFLEIRRRIVRESAKAQTKEARAQNADYLNRIERVGREIVRRQMIVLEGVGRKVHRTIDLTQDPEGTSLEPVTLTLDGVETTFSMDILGVDRVNREIRVGLNIETPDPELGRQTRMAAFSVSYFDFPMIDNSRLLDSQRCAVVLNAFSEKSADITLVLFPGAYASLKEKPYYNEVIESVLNANKKLNAGRGHWRSKRTVAAEAGRCSSFLADRRTPFRTHKSRREVHAMHNSATATHVRTTIDSIGVKCFALRRYGFFGK